ncbi:inorganic phosphate transporter Pho88 [Mucor mucedo]|uniref:inorganic phosphate transporter Pho88 n=1 Tax=Mucor mucedo TaxID=29922 RepID=UPI00221F4ACA|nr:inorganic phosphate transporter Pho88 [Mucor mucedo]KAI7888904.1 inorganic phosphate transporter Pho88 [Mucor mucedo]
MPSWNKVISHPLFNMVFFFGVRQVTKLFDLDNPRYISLIRSFYLGSQFVIILLSFYLLSVIKNKNDTTVLRYVQPGSKQWDGKQTPDKLVETTNMEYDIADVKKQLNQGFTGLAVVAFLHLKFGYVQPLIIQSILGFKNFFMTKEARIHLFHANTSTGELRRPFRIEGPLGTANEKSQPKTDKGSIKRVEKALKAQ